jgi:hypothetical protein
VTGKIGRSAPGARILHSLATLKPKR